MAVYEHSLVSIFAADGKLSGPVFIHIRRTKAYRKAYPSKNPTPAQRRAQNAFAFVDKRWTTASEATKDEWRNWRSWEMNWGYNRFQRINIPRRLAGLPVLMSPPTL